MMLPIIAIIKIYCLKLLVMIIKDLFVCQQSKNKLEYLNIDGALVELDYVSQENKDIQKRRKFLFRIATKSDTEYFLQAPSEQIRENW